MRIHHKSRCSLGVGLVGVMFAVITAVSLASFHPTSPTSTAAGGSDFRPGRIIDDVVFYNKDAMNAQQIQDFLNQKVPVCDTLGAKIYSGTKTRAQSGTERGYPPPYICLKDYRQDTPEKVASNYCDLLPAATDQSAAQIIYSVSQACGVNPQVLLVLLQKEQSLVTDDWPFEIQYRSATGYGCPDTAPCDAQYYGFFNQVFRAAWQYKVYRANPNNYNYRAGRNNYIQYNPNASCGGLNVYIENQATAGLYIYTPYVPNQKALENLYGTGDSCSAYGNRNFWRLFGDWFGSTMGLVTGPIADRYDQIKDTLGSPLDVQYCPDSDTCWQEFSYGVIIWNKHTGAWESKGSIRKRWSELGYQDGIMGYPTGPEVKTSDGGWWQFYEHGAIIGKPGTGYWESKGSIRKRWSELGYQNGSLGYPVGPEVLDSNGIVSQVYEHGVIIGAESSGVWESQGFIYTRWDELGHQDSVLKLPAGPTVSTSSGGLWQFYQNGAIIGTTDTGYWESSGGIRERWAELGYQDGIMGYPTGPEVKMIGGGLWQFYQNGAIIGTTDTGYWESSGGIRERWAELGYQDGAMKFPVGPMIKTSDGGWWQFYEHGAIIGKPGTGYWESKGSIRKRWSELGYQNGSLGYPVGPEVLDSNGIVSQVYEHGVIHCSGVYCWFDVK